MCAYLSYIFGVYPKLFGYTSFRALMGFLMAFAIVFWGMNPFIHLLQKWRHMQPIRALGPQSHQRKSNTPTMGGALIVLAVCFASLCFTKIANPYSIFALLGLVGFGFLGWLDDYTKTTQKHHAGLKAIYKLAAQLFISACLLAFLWYCNPLYAKGDILVPLFKRITLTFGSVGAFVWGVFFIAGLSNAVNLTDGLDGLAAGPIMTCALFLALCAFCSGNTVLASYFHIPYIPHIQELTVVSTAVLGAVLAFLWHNAPPAKIFMGDTGALGLGGMLACIATALRQELLLVIVGGIFIAEMLSVIIQVAYFKRTRKRFFLMAPLHHHFEQKGWSESCVVMRFWIISILLTIIGVLCIKIR